MLGYISGDIPPEVNAQLAFSDDFIGICMKTGLTDMPGKVVGSEYPQAHIWQGTRFIAGNHRFFLNRISIHFANTSLAVRSQATASLNMSQCS